MPALITHNRFAAAVQQQAKRTSYLSSCIQAAPMAFQWGAQGPDILFFHRPWSDNKVSQTGHRMHEERIYQIFSAMTNVCIETKSPIAAAYLMGFCCHYALDKTVHPFVTYIANYRLDPLYPKYHQSTLHNLCEAEFERAVLTKEGTDSAVYRADRMLTADAVSCETAASLFIPAVWEAYGTKLSAVSVSRSMHTMLQVQHLLHDKSGHRAQFLQHFSGISLAETVNSLIRPLKPLAADCLNLSHQPWIDAAHPYRRCYTDLFQLMQQAQQPALQLMDACYQSMRTGKPLPVQLFSLDYLGCPI